MNSFYVTIKGAAQGVFANESTDPTHQPAIAGVRFSMETVAPFDPTSGKRSGAAQPQPVRFSKAWGAASPQILRALVNDELLISVAFAFVRTDAAAIEDVFQTVQLDNAAVVDLRRTIDPLIPVASGGGQFLEEVALVYQKLTVTDAAGNTVASEFWGP